MISALFGLFQGGIVPSYAIIVREYFSPREAGTRLGLVLMATLLGMALGGWLSGLIFDLTGSYRAAFLNGLALEPGERVDHDLAVAAAPRRRDLANALTASWIDRESRTRRPAIPWSSRRPPGCARAASRFPAAFAP